MITLAIILTIILFLVAILVVTGGAFIAVFGDFLVAFGVIWFAVWIIKKIKGSGKKD